MASASPSPNSSPTETQPNSTTSSPPPPSTSSPPPSGPLTTALPPTISQPNATSDPPSSTNSSNSSSPPPQSSPPAVPATPPPVSLSPPPPTPLLSVPLPPISPPVLPPPPTTPPAREPPPTTPPVPPTTPAVREPPPSPPPAPLPVVPSSPPPVVSPPPPTIRSSPPPVSPSLPTASPPPPQEITPPPPSSTVSQPPPANSPPTLPSDSPPPPSATPPESVTVPPSLTPPSPSVSQPSPALPTNSPPTTSPPPINQTLPTPSSPSPPLPPSFTSPPVPPQNNSSPGGSSLVPTKPTPNQPSEIPTDGSTNTSSGVQSNANSTGTKGISTGGTVAIGLIAGFVVLSLIGMAVWFLRKQKKKVTGYNGGHVMPSPVDSSPVSDTSFIKAYSSAPLMGSISGSDFVYSPPDPGGLGNSRSWFSYNELLEVTNGFSEQNLLGEGGFGCVYKGCLADGREVAVKQLKIGGAQGEREFRAEVEIISRVHHRHLVSLVGYCISEHQRLLVYDYVPNDTLYFHLHGEGRPVLDWATRVKVATGAARGLSYLHEDCHPRIIHRDIKSSNILLDNDFEAQVSDFGLAKLALDAHTHITTRVMGTFGYMAPEYASSGKLTEKSDVYSFGVVLLELITGRKPVDGSQPLGDESLVEWARPLMSHALDNQDFEDLADPRLEKSYVENEMFRMIEAAAACVRHSAAKRPRMGQVVRALDGIGDFSDLSNGIRPGQSEVFDSAQQSAEIRMFRRMAFGSQDYSSDLFSRNSWRS